MVKEKNTDVTYLKNWRGEVGPALARGVSSVKTRNLAKALVWFM